MVTVILTAVLLLGLASLPAWLPNQVVRLRMLVFKMINGREGIAIPGDIGIESFEALYASPAANGRSRGAPLSDLFWYWLAPGPELHQEHLEPGARYEEVANTTRRILATPKKAAEELAASCAQRVLAEVSDERITLVRLRDLMMPIWAELYHEVVFGESPTLEARALIVANADDVVTALKCCSLRHMDRRDRLTRYLADRLQDEALRHPLPQCLDTHQRALYLQGVFFNTAIVQSSEAMAHVLLALAQHPDVLNRLLTHLEDDRAIDLVITETFRMWPLFGIAHRITSAAIPLADGTVLPSASVVCFDYPAYHRAGYDNADTFDPSRWENLSPRDCNYLPFGMPENRPCPAQAMALITMRSVTREVLRRFSLASSAQHTRSIPNRAPCWLIPRQTTSTVSLRLPMTLLRTRDRWEDVGRSIKQLVLGTYMVIDARQKRLCQVYFDAHDRFPTPVPPSASQDAPSQSGPAQPEHCPFGGTNP